MIGKVITAISNWFWNVIGSFFSNPSLFLHNFFHGVIHSIEEILIWGSIIFLFSVVMLGIFTGIFMWAYDFFHRNKPKWETEISNNNQIFNLKYRRFCIKGETNAWNNYSQIH